MFNKHHNYFNASSQRNNLIKSTHFGEAKKMAQDSHIGRAKENLKFKPKIMLDFYLSNSKKNGPH